MVIRGRTRGNGKQLAKYLMTKAENSDIHILDVNGRGQMDSQALRRALISMSLTSELTKSEKGLYHAQINPAYGEDSKMTPEKWMQAADILSKELGLEEQRRIIVLHTKKGRTHAHVAWERYDHEKGKMISDSFSRLAQDRARKEMELIFEQAPTPHRNAKRPEMKALLSELWRKAKTGHDFIREADKAGYTIAAGEHRRPYIVIDETGRSFDLVRQLDNTKTKDVREQFKNVKLPREKSAFVNIKSNRTERNIDSVQEKLIDKIEQLQENEKLRTSLKNIRKAVSFANNKSDVLKTGKEKTAEDFAKNKKELIQQEKLRIQQMKKNLDKNKGLERD